MDPFTMMAASIGMQFFNNYANNSKSKEIQAQQREFQMAAAVHDFDRMRKAQAAAAKLALELEADVHKERLEDIEKSYDSLLEKFANDFAISNWPLNVLPFIMKGESFGSLFGGTSKSICMHCIFTPSNCQWFNEYFYDDLDLRIEAEMNKNWNAQSTHPVVYYGGGWNRRQNRQNGTSIPSSIDLVDIELLKTQLKQIPTMVITPYFEPYLYFKVQLWGMGKNLPTPIRIDIPHGEIDSLKRIFSHDYCKDDKPNNTDDLFNTTMEEVVLYISSLIGFVADKYFLDFYGRAPMLPTIIHSRRDTSRLLVQIYKKRYLGLIKSPDDYNLSVNDGVKQLRLLNAISKLDKESGRKDVESYFVDFCQPFSLSHDIQDCIDECLQSNALLPFLKEFLQICPQYRSFEVQIWLEKIEQEQLDTIDDYICYKVSESSIEKITEVIETEKCDYYKPRFFCFCIWNSTTIVGEFFNKSCNPMLCNGMHHRTIIIHMSHDFTPIKNIDFYEYDILTKSISIMNSKKQQLVSDLRKRFGNILIKHGQRMVRENDFDNHHPSVKNNPWEPNTALGFSIDDVINYFTHEIDEGKMETMYVDHAMSISIVLDWLDSISIANENKLYLIKGYVKEHNCFIYCAVLAENDKLLLSNGPTKCFICPKESDEIKEIFGDKNVYVVPFTD